MATAFGNMLARVAASISPARAPARAPPPVDSTPGRQSQASTASRGRDSVVAQQHLLPEEVEEFRAGLCKGSVISFVWWFLDEEEHYSARARVVRHDGSETMIRLLEDPVFQGHVVRFPAANVDPTAGCPIRYKDVHIEQQPRKVVAPRVYAEEFQNQSKSKIKNLTVFFCVLRPVR
eukprot:PhM_4_TR2401/c2_g1_i1/m.18656